MKKIIFDLVTYEYKNDLQAIKACKSLHEKNELIESLHLNLLSDINSIGYKCKDSIIIDAIYSQL